MSVRKWDKTVLNPEHVCKDCGRSEPECKAAGDALHPEADYCSRCGSVAEPEPASHRLPGLRRFFTRG